MMSGLSVLGQIAPDAFGASVTPGPKWSQSGRCRQGDKLKRLRARASRTAIISAACPTVWARSELPRWPCSPLPRFRDSVPAG